MSSQKKRSLATGQPAWLLQKYAENQIALASIPIILILAANVIQPPKYQLKMLHALHSPAHPSMHVDSWPGKFLIISYLDPLSRDSQLCYKGPDDAYIVVFWVLIWTVAREVLMRYFWYPLGRAWGIKKQGDIMRFAEQGWSLAYYTVFWLMGAHIMATSPYSPYPDFDLSRMWRGYPFITISAHSKWYYLVQTAFIIQQLIVLNIEKKRKDFTQMLSHHIITIALVVASYTTNNTPIGTAILSVMDFTDIVLPAAKMLKYMGLTTACDAAFGLFIVSWIITRHVLFGILLYSVIVDVPRYTPYIWEPARGLFLDYWSHHLFILALGALQFIILLWLFMILRVLYKILTGANAEDVRSDSEDDDMQPEEAEPLVATNGQTNGLAHAVAKDVKKRQ
ncbi:hypothetical protein E5Q_03446 [Mixia osmundae IAM 14324]|uniref:TLC domain-containing protein n=1 Tax=Mixia osmundae (strain CBS 9802 / IAM 14324 / JCM 22182 / KY 12970) TaxID=764103 RepID=G7E1R5_MIXOS|nr:hypothetical protein E5Q_03446 [Mixia osmundae IAM 14324]